MTDKTPPDNTELRTADKLRKELWKLFENITDKKDGRGTVNYFFDDLIPFIATKTREARIKARSKLLHKLIRTYSLIAPPIKESPMELTDEAKYYNKFAKDLHKFVELEFAKHEALKPPTGEK